MSVTSTPEAWAETGFAAGESYAMAAHPVVPGHAELYTAATAALSETEGAKLATPYMRYCYTAAFIGAAEQYIAEHPAGPTPEPPLPPARSDDSSEQPVHISLAGAVSASGGAETA